MNIEDHVEEVRKLILEAGSGGGLALDIDDTCAETMAGFIKELGKQWPPPREFSVDEAKEFYVEQGNPIYWGTIPEAVEYEKKLAKDGTFHGTFDPIPEALKGVQWLKENNILSCYATARVTPMIPYTDQWLKKYNLPTDIPAIHRPLEFKGHHTEWKAELLHKLYPLVQGAVDDNLKIAEHLERLGYRGKLFLFGPGSNLYEPQTEAIIPCANWNEVIAEVEQYLL